MPEQARLTPEAPMQEGELAGKQNEAGLGSDLVVVDLVSGEMAQATLDPKNPTIAIRADSSDEFIPGSKDDKGNTPDAVVDDSEFADFHSGANPEVQRRKDSVDEKDPSMMPRVMVEAQLQEREESRRIAEAAVAHVESPPTTPPALQDATPESVPMEQTEDQADRKPEILFIPWSDTPVIHAHFNKLYLDPRTDDAFEFDKYYNIDQAGNKSMAEQAHAIWACGFNYRYAIVEHGHPVVVGYATICNINQTHRTAQVKFVIDPELQGRGFTEVVFHGIAKMCMEVLKLEHIFIRVVMHHGKHSTHRGKARAAAIGETARRAGVFSDVVLCGDMRKSIILYEVNQYYYNKKYKAGQTA